MGMDDFAQKLAGKIVFVQLPEPGKALRLASALRRSSPANGSARSTLRSTASWPTSTRNLKAIPA
jgi:hypothetical protein